MVVGNFRAEGQVIPLEEASVGRRVRVGWVTSPKARRRKESLSTQAGLDGVGRCDKCPT